MKYYKDTLLILVVIFIVGISNFKIAQANESNNGSASDNQIEQVDLNNKLEDKQRKKVSINLSVYAFMSKINGDIGMGGIAIYPKLPFSSLWKNLDSGFMGKLDMKYGKWGLSFDHQYSKFSMQKQAGTNGLGYLDVDLGMKSNRTSVGVYYTAVDNFNKQKKTRFLLEPTIGVHFNKASANIYVPATATSLSRSASWNEPYLGLRFSFEFNKKWNLFGQVDFGSKHSNSYQMHLAYKVKIFNLPTDIFIGYRIMTQKSVEGDFNWYIKRQGPVIGINFKLS